MLSLNTAGIIEQLGRIHIDMTFFSKYETFVPQMENVCQPGAGCNVVLNRHLIEGETSSKNKVLISAQHMADVQDSQVKCYTHCLDSPTATQSSVSTSNCNKNVCNTVSQYRPKIV